jgi:hypothetical protein
MNRDLPLVPWADGPADPSNQLEHRAAELFSQVQIPVRFDPRRVAIGARLPPSSRRSQVRRRAARLGLLLAGALLGGAGLVVAARGIPALGRWLLSDSSSSAGPLPAGSPPPARDDRLPAAPVPSVALLPAPADPAPPAMVPHSRPATRTTPAPARPQPSALAEETHLLRGAFAQLHRRGDARAALAALDAYAVRFPRGLLRKEAASVRVESLLALGQRRGALAVLQSFPFGPGARDVELRLLRGELGAAWDCPAALADFEAVLRTGPPAPLAERARQGRAACQARIDGGGTLPEHRDEKKTAR